MIMAQDASQIPEQREDTDENARLMRALVELRGSRIASPADSAHSYDELHDEGRLRLRDSFYMWLLSLLGPKPGQTLLEISCGQGLLLRAATERDCARRVLICHLQPSKSPAAGLPLRWSVWQTPSNCRTPTTPLTT